MGKKPNCFPPNLVWCSVTVNLGKLMTIARSGIYIDNKIAILVHSCAFFTCWYAYELATGGSVGVWLTDLDWKMRVKVIAQQVFISLVSKKIKMKNLFDKTVYHKFN